MRRLTLVLLAIVISENVSARGFWDQFKDPDDGRFDTSAFLADNGFSEFKDAPSRVAKGGGFRYLVAKRYGFEMGVDIAHGPEEDVFYIQGGTAWR